MFDANVGTPVPATFFGLTYLQSGYEPQLADISYGVLGKQPATSWHYIESTTRGVRDWSVLDAQAAFAVANGLKITYFFQGTPGWAVADHSAGTGATNAITGQWVSNLPPDDENDLLNFINDLIARYGSTIQAYGTWIEPADGPTPTATVVFYGTRVHDRVRALAPSAKLLSPTLQFGSTAPGQYYDQLYAAGFPTDCDVVAMHIYPAQSTPSEATDVYLRMDGNFPLLRKYGLTSKPIWDVESSWGQDTVEPDSDRQAAYVSQSLLLRWGLGVSQHHWYGYSGFGWGSLYSSGTLQAGGLAWNRTRGWMLGNSLLTSFYKQDDVWWAWWLMANGNIAISAFCKTGTRTVVLPNTVTWSQYTDLDGNVTAFSGNTVSVGIKPIWIEGALNGQKRTSPTTFAP